MSKYKDENEQFVEKGLFTFYKQQQQFQQWMRRQKKKKSNQNKSNENKYEKYQKQQKQQKTYKKMFKNDYNLMNQHMNDNEKYNHLIKKTNKKYSDNNIKIDNNVKKWRSFENVEIKHPNYIENQEEKKINSDKQVQQSVKTQNYGDSVVIILKGKGEQENNNNLNKNNNMNNNNNNNKKSHSINPRYKQTQGYFIKKKSLNFSLDEQVNNQMKIMDDQQLISFQANSNNNKHKMKIHHVKNLSERKHLENSSLNSWREMKIQNMQTHTSGVMRMKRASIDKQEQLVQDYKYQKLKRINMLPEIYNPSSEHHQYNNTNRVSSISVKRVPPKILHSILKSGNIEMIRNVRRALDQELGGADGIKSVKNNKNIKNNNNNKSERRNHSFIEYNNLRYEDPEREVEVLNDKQRKIINILNKFRK